jgi:hypothetical protein
MRLQFKLPTESLPIGIDGVLVRANPHSSGVVWGLKFLEAQVNTQVKIEEYLDACVLARSRSPLEPDSEPGSIGSPMPKAMPAYSTSTPSVLRQVVQPPAVQRQAVKPPAVQRQAAQRQAVKPPAVQRQEKPRLTVAPDAQFIRMYEEAMISASLKRQAADAKHDKATRIEAEPPTDRRSKGRYQPGSPKDLSAELQWLYDQAEAKKREH